jgi:hypothetical protein
MDSPVQLSERPDRSTLHDVRKSIKLWLIIAVIGLFVLALFYTLKIAADFFLPRLVEMIPGLPEKQNVVEIASEGNLATLIFLGRWLTLNPIAIILTFLLWSYLWGLVGTLLAVPILATFKIFCDRIEPLKRLGSFLGRP